MESILHDVRPVRPAAPYLGGKRHLSTRICGLLALIPHRTYVEPFVGMGGIFLRRDRKPPVEVINDVSGDVTTLYRVLQRHYPYLIDMLRWRITSRGEFERLMREDASTLTDLERAARFLYLQRLAFGGKVQGRAFGVSRTAPGRFDVTKLEPLLADLHERLAGVVIERLPYAEVIAAYDGPDTLFYLDPPYVDCERDYGASFGPEDFRRLGEVLGGLKGRFVLSVNDRPLAREAFSAFDLEEVPVTYTVGAKEGGGQRTTELIVSSCGALSRAQARLI